MFNISSNVLSHYPKKFLLTYSSFEYKKLHHFLLLTLDKSISSVRISEAQGFTDILYFFERNKNNIEYLVMSQNKKSIIKI